MLLKGKKLLLTGIKNEGPVQDANGNIVPSDWDLISSWHTEGEILRNITDDVGRFRSREELKLFLSENYRHPNGRMFVIRACPENADQPVPIGYVGANNLDYKNRRCSLVYLVHDKESEKEMGKEAVSLMCEYLNKELGFHRVETLFNEGDDIRKDVFKSAGFRQEGILKDFQYFGGKFRNSLLMSWMGG